MSEDTKYFIVGGILAAYGGVGLNFLIMIPMLFPKGLSFFIDSPRYWVGIISAPICLVIGVILLIIGRVKSKQIY